MTDRSRQATLALLQVQYSTVFIVRYEKHTQTKTQTHRATAAATHHHQEQQFREMKTMRFTTKILPSVRSKHMGVITLNNPEALHALTLDMIDTMNDVLGEWLAGSSELSPSSTPIRSILIKSSNDETKRRAFCAGGDVKSLYEHATASSNESSATSSESRRPQDFFFEEYKLNYAIATSPVPIVSLWDGVVFGGGVGISVHGKYRVATEHALFAMPETAIGLYPDVGGLWFLPRIMMNQDERMNHPNPLANYLALTGHRTGPADLLFTGLATHYVPSNRITDLEDALADATATPPSGSDISSDVDRAIARVLMSFHECLPTDDCPLVSNKRRIEKCFTENSVERIMSNLTDMAAGEDASYDEKDAEFAKVTLKSLQKMSPTSLKVTLEGMKRGAACRTIDEDLKMEYRISTAFLRRNSDFFEGVRAALVDKDRSPKWNPSTLEQVTQEMVDEFFTPVRDGREWTIPSLISNRDQDKSSRL